MAYTTIDKPTDYFNTVLWAGNSDTTRNITGVGFQPDWSWVKNRSLASDHRMHDAVRGANKGLVPNGTDAEDSSTTAVKSFLSDGIQVGTEQSFNRSGDNHVGWFWKANGSGSSNTDGSITSSVSANTTAGFSIVSYTGTGSNATVGHGLGVAPKWILAKSRDAAENWVVFHKSLNSSGAGTYIYLNTTAASGGGGSNTSIFNNTAPTSSVFSIGTDGNINNSSDDYIAYCFAEKKGYSKFGSYTGNGSTDGTFIYTGFKPAFIMCKRTDSTGVWFMCDNKRVGFNGRPNNTATVGNPELSANDSRSEAAGNTNVMDIFSNGFKLIQSGAEINGSGASFIFMALAENPFVTSTGIPTTAR